MISLHSAATIERTVELCEAQHVEAVLVDLGTPGLKPNDLAERLAPLATGRPAIVAFGPHVHEALLSAAREAGCDEVVSRGQFSRNLTRSCDA